LIRKFHEEFCDEAGLARSEIWSKSAELNPLLNSSTPDAGKVRPFRKRLEI